MTATEYRAAIIEQRERDMYQIEKTQNGRKVILKDGITRQIKIWDTQEDAQIFANSCFANARCDYRNQGKKLPQYKVVVR